MERRYQETSSDYMRELMEKYMAEQPCPACKGHRLNKEALAVPINGKNIGEVTEMSVQRSA